MEIGAGQPTSPVLGVICTRQTQNIRPGSHALTKFLGKTREGLIIHPERSDAIPAKGNRDPSCIQPARSDGCCCGHLIGYGSKPGATRRRRSKCQELVSRCKRGRAVDQKMLEIVEFKCGDIRLGRRAIDGLRQWRTVDSHRTVAPSGTRLYCIRSSISENFALSCSAFLISSAVAYGYSPYSRKLGHWCSRTNLTNADTFVFQSSGNPSRFSKTVFTPTFLNKATASSVYLSKSVSKIPWYMKYVSFPISKRTHRR